MSVLVRVVFPRLERDNAPSLRFELRKVSPLVEKSALDAVLKVRDSLSQAKLATSEYRLHAAAADIFAVKNLPTCSKYVSQERVLLVKSGLGAKFIGYYRCKAFQICPICNTIWLREQHRKLNSVLRHWNGDVTSVALTVDHTATDSFSTVLRNLSKVRQQFVDALDKRARWLAGRIFRIEISLGPNGWHPHIHGMLFSRKSISEDDLSEIEEHWRTAARAAGRRVGKEAALARLLPDRASALSQAAYMWKRAASSPFSLLAVVLDPSTAPDIVADAKSLWRAYCRGLGANPRLRFITTAGEIRTTWAAYSRQGSTSERALERIARYLDECEEIAGRDWLASRAEQFLNSVLHDDDLSPYDPEVRAQIDALEYELEQAIERRHERGASDEWWDPANDEVDRIMGSLSSLRLQKRGSKTTAPGLISLTPLGAKLLTPWDKAELTKARDHADARRRLEPIMRRLGSGIEPWEIYSLNYDNQEINSMALPSMGPSPVEE